LLDIACLDPQRIIKDNALVRPASRRGPRGGDERVDTGEAGVRLAFPAGRTDPRLRPYAGARRCAELTTGRRDIVAVRLRSTTIAAAVDGRRSLSDW
jgi:hypothetical protein